MMEPMQIADGGVSGWLCALWNVGRTCEDGAGLLQVKIVDVLENDRDGAELEV